MSAISDANAERAAARTGGRAASGPEVRLVYLTPSDGTFDDSNRLAIQAAARNLQIWYRNEMGNGKTFHLHEPAVEWFVTPHDSDWYRTNPTGPPEYDYWQNALADAFAITGGFFNDPDNIWIYYLDVATGCGQITGGTSGVALMHATDLEGLTSRTQTGCGWPPSQPLCRFVGGDGHEIGHALGLPHPAGCDAGTADPDLCTTALMFVAYTTYPSAVLTDDDRTFLNSSPFFRTLELPSLLPPCGCGDGDLDAGETCDDGDANSDVPGSACRTSCSLPACGDGITDPGEACDDGEPSLTCDADCTLAECGDGTLNIVTGEQCDDGNTANGDCCSSLCQLPTGCLTGATGSLKLNYFSDDTRNSLSWMLARGDAFAFEDLGDPSATTTYSLCVLTQTSGNPTTLLTSLTIAPDMTKWQAKAPSFSYKDADGTSDGVQKVKLKSGDVGKTQLKIQARGSATPMPAPFGGLSIFEPAAEVSVRLVASNTDTCWQNSFLAAEATSNTGLKFSARKR